MFLQPYKYCRQKKANQGNQGNQENHFMFLQAYKYVIMSGMGNGSY